jgi:hypothetical protein
MKDLILVQKRPPARLMPVQKLVTTPSSPVIPSVPGRRRVNRTSTLPLPIGFAAQHQRRRRPSAASVINGGASPSMITTYPRNCPRLFWSIMVLR